MGNRFRFVLAPIEHGWVMQVFEGAEFEDLSRLTPPYHFVPNPPYLEGWHFRNSGNSGPNVGDVNDPQRIREFVFSPEVAGMKRNPTSEDVERIRGFGGGRLEILDFGLGNLREGERAKFTWLRFRVKLRWS